MQQPAPSQQRADVDGQGNVTVQIVGENNRVTIAGAAAALRLTMFPRRREEGGEMGLLSAYTQSIDLVGREPEKAELRAWLDSERDIAIQVRTGKAGTGKTRLAFDLCDQLQNEGGWQAGFVNGEQLANLVADAGARWGWDQPTLAVVDYAAERADALHRWFGQLADFAPLNAPPLRILLLERQADPQSGWLQTALGTGDSQARTVKAMLDPAVPVDLPGLTAHQDRRAVLDSFFAKLGSPIRTPPAGADPEFDRRLDELTWGGEPLFLMMAALLAAGTSLPQVLDLPRTEIAHEVAEREIGRIRRLARERKLDPDLLGHMAAYVTLCQGLARNALLDAIETEAAQTRRGIPAGAAIVANALADALPGTAATLEPVRPDALGEALVLLVFGDQRIDGAAAVTRAFKQAGPPVVAFVIRTAQDFASAGHDQPLVWLDALTQHGPIDLDQLMMIADQLPQASLALLVRGAKITATIVARLREEVEAGKDYRVPSLASALNNLAIRLSAVGQRQEALAPAQEAADLYRELAAKAPDAYRPDLAMSLSVLADRLEDLERVEEAVASDEDAIRAIAEPLLRLPQGWSSRALMILRDYSRRCEKIGREPDMDLLAPIVEVLQRMQDRSADNDEGGGSE